ncbi:MAG: hypothetical protein ACYTFY_19240 [Planctomycetota bacterium]|jgi:hypothetical protein
MGATCSPNPAYLQGIFKVKGRPVTGSAEVIDENDQVVETIFINNRGQIKVTPLNREGKIRVKTRTGKLSKPMQLNFGKLTIINENIE